MPATPENGARATVGTPQERISGRRQRLRWMFILSMGLRAQPIYTASGEQEPRRVTRHIPRGGQSYADARSEFAGRLVAPSGPHVAHVRLLSGHHETKVRVPIELQGEGGVTTRTPNPNQPDDIRTRSRAMASVQPDDRTIIPMVRPDHPQPRRVTRRPRPEPEGDAVM